MVKTYVIRDAQAKMLRGILDLAILQLIKENKQIHGYGIITTLRKRFGMYFGPSSIYPLLSSMEEKGYLESSWDLKNDRPRKVYALTPDGTSLLNGTQVSFDRISRIMSSPSPNLKETITPLGEEDKTSSVY